MPGQHVDDFQTAVDLCCIVGVRIRHQGARFGGHQRFAAVRQAAVVLLPEQLEPQGLELSVDPVGHQLRLPADEQFTQVQALFDAFKFGGQRPFLLLQRQNALPLGLCRVQVD